MSACSEENSSIPVGPVDGEGEGEAGDAGDDGGDDGAEVSEGEGEGPGDDGGDDGASGEGEGAAGGDDAGAGDGGGDGEGEGEDGGEGGEGEEGEPTGEGEGEGEPPQACGADAACDEAAYCAASGQCIEDGQCAAQEDCQNPDNAWDRVLCEGVVYCGKDGCAVACGDDGGMCFDFADERIDFGACRQVLGWGMFGAECRPISGCDAGGFQLSQSQEECERECLGLVPGGACEQDDDCAPAGFCRPLDIEGDEAACHPYRDEGDRCGGFVMPQHQERCPPEMACTDIPEGLADAPGICRDRCTFDNPEPVDEWGPDRYCSRNDACRDQGDCFDHLDCELRTNAWPHIECVGYGVCGDDGSCGWRCGDARCRDLSGVFFGFCERLLGFGVRNGVCETISGCDDPEYPLFETLRECRDLCEAQR